MRCRILRFTGSGIAVFMLTLLRESRSGASVGSLSELRVEEDSDDGDDVDDHDADVDDFECLLHGGS